MPTASVHSRTSSHLARTATRSCTLCSVHHIQHINRLILNWLVGETQCHILFVCWLQWCDLCMQTGNFIYAAFCEHARRSTVRRNETLRHVFSTVNKHNSGFPASTFMGCRPDALWLLLAEFRINITSKWSDTCLRGLVTISHVSFLHTTCITDAIQRRLHATVCFSLIGKYRVRQKNLTVFKSRYIGNRVGWGNATKVSG